MTTTNCFQGLQGGKNTSRVLQPPGGGSSNIFGAAEPAKPSSTNHQQSSVFGGPTAAQANTPTKKNPETQDRLFGAEARRLPPSKKEDTKGNVFGGDPPSEQKHVNRKGQDEESDSDDDEKKKDVESETNNNEKPVEAEVARPASVRPRGSCNPIIGGDADAAQSSPHSSTRIHQPPGGKSSKLW